MQFTWKHAAPYSVTIECKGPVRAEVAASKVLPGRFSVRSRSTGTRRNQPRPGDARIHAGRDDHRALDIAGQDDDTREGPGAVPGARQREPGVARSRDARLKHRCARRSCSSAPRGRGDDRADAMAERVDGTGNVLDAPLKLATNMPVRVEIASTGRRSPNAARHRSTPDAPCTPRAASSCAGTIVSWISGGDHGREVA